MTTNISYSWTPFDCFVIASQTPAGLLEPEPNEVELMVVTDVELRSAMQEPMVPVNEKGYVDSTVGKQWKDRTPPTLTVTLTTHRIVLWKDDDDDDRTSSSSINHKNDSTHDDKQKNTKAKHKRRLARYIPLANVLTTESVSAYFKSPKLLITTYSGDVFLVFGKLAFKIRDELHEHLQKALSRKEWEKGQQQQQQLLVSRRHVGVDAVIRKSEARHRQAARLTETAFEGDIETLLQEALELVQIIQKYVATLDRSESGSAADADQDNTAKLVGYLQDMGMTSAFRKADFKGREDSYYIQVARQLADFLRPKLATVKVMTLTDVYCLFNRARGSNLLSPEDLNKAVERLQDLQLGMCLVEFPSGLKVIQDDSVDAATLALQFQEMAVNGVTPLEASRKCHLSAVLVMEQLQAAERLGYLVRDETLETIRFYPNKFKEWVKD